MYLFRGFLQSGRMQHVCLFLLFCNYRLCASVTSQVTHFLATFLFTIEMTIQELLAFWLFIRKMWTMQTCCLPTLVGSPTSFGTVNKNLPVPVTVHVLKPEVLFFILLRVLLYLCLTIFPSSPGGRTRVQLCFVFFPHYGIPGSPLSLLVSKTHLTMGEHKCCFNSKYQPFH